MNTVIVFENVKTLQYLSWNKQHPDDDIVLCQTLGIK